MAAVEKVPEADWMPFGAGGNRIPREVDSEDEAIAEAPFVSNEIGYSKREGIIRYIAIRRALPDALGVYDDESPHRPDKPAHAIRVLITNNPALGEGRADGLGPEPMAAQPALKLLNGRCGDAEQAHDALKNGLAGGTMPSGRFGANAAWWMCAVPAFNLHALTAWWTLGEDLARGRLQADPAGPPDPRWPPGRAWPPVDPQAAQSRDGRTAGSAPVPGRTIYRARLALGVPSSTPIRRKLRASARGMSGPMAFSLLWGECRFFRLSCN